MKSTTKPQPQEISANASVADYLRAIIVLRKQGQRKQMVNGYSCLEDFVLKHGRGFKADKLKRPPNLCTPRACFKNATKLALNEGLIYVEGYAWGVIPTEHAWCVDAGGVVHDNTWPESYRWKYFGIAFLTDYLYQATDSSGVFGLIGQGHQAVALLRKPPRLWKHPICETPY